MNSTGGWSNAVLYRTKSRPQLTCVSMSCILEGGSSFTSSAERISNGREKCLPARSNWILSLPRPTEASPTAVLICISIGKQLGKTWKLQIRPAAKLWSWLRNSPKLTLPVEWRFQRCEIIPMRRRNFGPQFASIPASMRPTTSTDALAWRRESSKRQSNRFKRLQEFARKIIRRLSSWEQLTQDSDIRLRPLPPMPALSKLRNSNWRSIRVMCAHYTWELFRGRESAIEKKPSHGPQKRWRWIRRTPRFFITWAASTRCCI